MGPSSLQHAEVAAAVALLLSLALAIFTLPMTSDLEQRIRFEFVARDGRRISEAHFAGTHAPVFFGLTLCPQVRPTQRVTISAIIDALTGELEGQLVVAVYISLGPERVGTRGPDFSFRFDPCSD